MKNSNMSTKRRNFLKMLFPVKTDKHTITSTWTNHGLYQRRSRGIIALSAVAIICLYLAGIFMAGIIVGAAALGALYFWKRSCQVLITLSGSALTLQMRSTRVTYDLTKVSNVEKHEQGMQLFMPGIPTPVVIPSYTSHYTELASQIAEVYRARRHLELVR